LEHTHSIAVHDDVPTQVVIGVKGHLSGFLTHFSTFHAAGMTDGDGSVQMLRNPALDSNVREV
jgi:hypothetical protein